jgi:NADPH:quinone reductase
LPLIIYGASSSLGTFAVKLAKASNIHPIIAICGGSKDYVSGLLDPAQGDCVVDYRQGPALMKDAVKKALGGLVALHALDAITSQQSWVPLTQLVDPQHGQISVVSGANAYNEPEIPEGVEIKYTFVGTAHIGEYKPGMPKQPSDKESVRGDVEFAYVMLRYVARMLASGTFSGHPVEVIPGGLGGVGKGLQRLKAGDARGVKFVYRISETEGLA